jgi:hypothetical protein
VIISYWVYEKVLKPVYDFVVKFIFLVIQLILKLLNLLFQGFAFIFEKVIIRLLIFLNEAGFYEFILYTICFWLSTSPLEYNQNDEYNIPPCVFVSLIILPFLNMYSFDLHQGKHLRGLKWY